MSTYINAITMMICDLSDLRTAYPHMSFPPAGPDDETLARLGYARIIPTAPPTVTETQRVSEGQPAPGDAGTWRQTWVVEDMSAEEVTARLDAAKAAACARIDAEAEALRNTVLTPGSGQMAAYQAKGTQATAYLQDGDPTEAEYPDLYNEVGITADTVHEVAMAVLAAAEKWRLFGRAIERARLAGKQAVKAATSVSGIAAAEAAVEWPST